MWLTLRAASGLSYPGGDPLRNSLDIYAIPTPTSRFGVSCNGQPLIHLWHRPPSDEDIVDPVPHVVEDVTKLVWGVMAMEPDSRRHRWGKHIPEPPERLLGPRIHFWPSARRRVSPSHRIHGMRTTGPARIDQPHTIFRSSQTEGWRPFV